MRSIETCAFLVLCSFMVWETSAAMGKVVCYYGSWAIYRPGNGKFDVEDIDPFGCTHAIYGFLGINNDGSLAIKDKYNDVTQDALRRFTNMKQKNGNLKTLVAVGGWNEGSEKFSKVARDAGARKRTIDGAVSFLKKYGFDGFDLDWEYPNQREGSNHADKANFATWLREFRAEFNRHGFLLSAAVGASQNAIDLSYDVPALNKNLDFVNVMAYDFHGASFDTTTGHNAPMKPAPGVMSSVDAWLNAGLSPSKLILGVPAYGHTYTLADPGNPAVGARHSGAGREGPYTRESGMLGYNEICEYILQGGWTQKYDSNQKVPYMYKGNQWISYDNPDSIAIKVKYAKSRGLGGVMMWSCETDDFRGKCGERNPILASIKRNN